MLRILPAAAGHRVDTDDVCDGRGGNDVDNDAAVRRNDNSGPVCVDGATYGRSMLLLPDYDGPLVVMASCDHCAANAMCVACPLGDDDGAVHDLGTPPSALAGCALQIGPLLLAA